jgi:hypothetical protein
MTISIACPCCKRELYVSTHPGGLYSPEMAGSEPYWRDDKCFMECRHCRCEVQMEGSGYVYPSTTQLCRRRAI